MLGATVCAYVWIVGGDWMPSFRFLAAFEPFCFLLACLGLRSVLDPAAAMVVARQASRGLSPRLIAVSFGVVVIGLAAFLAMFRAEKLASARRNLIDEKVFWDSAAGATADWLLFEGRPGAVALGDIGYIGYATDYPVLDLLGLVDPVISKLPGGYTRKTGPDFVSHVFQEGPRYFVFIGTNTCRQLAFPRQEILRTDCRFQQAYHLAGAIAHSKRGKWCIFERDENAHESALDPGATKPLGAAPHSGMRRR
jgi:hypothetical protein